MNRKLGKKEVKCNFKWLDMRWRTGHGNPACDDEDALGRGDE